MKKLSISFYINFVFAFILLSFSLRCIYQNSTDPSLFDWCTKINTPERDWSGWPSYGDLRVYSIFIKRNLFKEDFNGHVLVMSGPNETKPELSIFSWPFLISYYLLPVKIEIDNSYDFVLDEISFKKLSKLPLITRMYGQTNKNNLAKRYCLVQGLEANDYKKWAIYVFPTKEAVNIFTIPIGWQGIKESN